MVLPIICSEYYLVKLAYELEILGDIDNTNVRVCIDKGFYSDVIIYSEDNDRLSEDIKYCKNLERARH